ncbi:MAG: sulfotransferase [Alteromonadaceae bacterium]|nr:sulfotransferase [Alteromonadaceae bacterium]
MEDTSRSRAIIVGAPRSGTTTLWRQLAQHPRIAPSRIKELNFLHDPALAATAYDDHFEPDGSATLEASPVYFREHETIAPRLAASFPDARLVFILREPAARLLAGFRSARDWDRNIAQGVDFAQFVEIIAKNLDPLPVFPTDRARAIYATDAKKVGLYADILGHYLEHFDAAQMHILFLDDLKSAPEAALAAICRHIGVDPQLMPRVSTDAQNQGVEVGNLRLFAFARRMNAMLEPLFNRAPWARAALRKLHHALNAKPADRSSEGIVAALAQARGWYAVPNHRLAALLEERFPDVARPAWLEETTD